MLQSKHVLRTGIKSTPYQKSYKLMAGTQSQVIDSMGANKQSLFFSISLADDNSDQHRSIYDSYTVERACTDIKSITLENTSNTYSTFKTVKFDTKDSHNQFYSIANLLCGTVKVLALHPCPIMQTTPCFRNCLPKANTLQLQMKKYLSI